MKKNNTLSYRVGQLEKNYDNLDKKIEVLLINHLPSIEKQIVALKTEMRSLTVINVAAIIIGILIAKYI